MEIISVGVVSNRYEINGKSIKKNALFFKTLPYDIVEYSEFNEIIKIVSRPSRITVGEVNKGELTLPLLSTTFKVNVNSDDGLYTVKLPELTLTKETNLYQALVNVYSSVENISYPIVKVSSGHYTKGFQDQTHLETFTVDPQDSIDADDAISLEIIDGVLTRFYTHIVDIDIKEKDYFPLGMTFYNPEGNIYATPTNISLMKGVKRRVITTEFLIKDNKVIKYDIYPAEIIIKNSYNYQNFIPPNELVEFVQINLYPNVINIPSINLKVKNGVVQSHTVEYSNDINHKIIETLMVLTNVAVATHLKSKGLSFPSRYHPQKKQQFADFVHPNPIVSSYIILRNYSKAYYSVNYTGHTALDLEKYTHFTSPLRRYPDLMVHRILAGYEYPQMAKMVNYLNQREELIEKIYYYYNRKMKSTLNQNNDKYIIHISSAGITILDPVLLIDDFIHISQILPKDKYVFKDNQLIGPQKIFRLGDKLSADNKLV